MDHLRDLVANWSNDRGPVGKRLRRTLANRARAFPLGCCGHPGEPGC